MAASGFALSFRGRLKRELLRWVELGLVDQAAAQKLRAHYGLDSNGVGGAIVAAYVLGVLLIGGGVISLVAYNWEVIPGGLKLFLAAAMLVAAHVVGFRFAKAPGDRPRIGQALLFAGTLLLGANIGVAAQVFNVSSDGATGIGVWAFGALAAAWLYDSGPTAALALLLANFWAADFAEHHRAIAPALGFVLAALFLPLTWRLRSRALFAAVVVGLTILQAIGVSHAGRAADPVTVILLTTALLAAWSFAARGDTAERFAPIARGLAVLTVGGAAYLLSFHDLAEVMHEHGSSEETILSFVPLALAAVGVAAWGLAREPGRWRAHPVTIATFAGALALLVASVVPDQEVGVAVAANLAVLALAATLLVTAARGLERLPFWAGSLLAALTILSRFLEFDTELWLKGMAFIGCGAAVLWIGVTFERRLKAKGVAHAA